MAITAQWSSSTGSITAGSSITMRSKGIPRGGHSLQPSLAVAVLYPDPMERSGTRLSHTHCSRARGLPAHSIPAPAGNRLQ